MVIAVSSIKKIQFDLDEEVRVGIIGTGFIARGLNDALRYDPIFTTGSVLTRRTPGSLTGFDSTLITNSYEELLANADIIVECSGDVIYATPLIREALQARIPVVTMDAELQITTGSYLTKFGGYLTEAEGDQPGSLAALHKEVIEMGFQPVVYGNVKGFLNLNPTRKEMEKWSQIQGISLSQVTSFTDGTKVQIEQVLVANGLEIDLAPNGMIGGQTQYDGFLEGALALGEYAKKLGVKLSDFLMCTANPSPGRDKAPPGVFIVAEHQTSQAAHLKYYKMGEGAQYVLQKPFHLCHLEILKTLRNVIKGEPPLLTNNTHPRYSVSAIAKRSMKPGDIIDRGIGGFQTRGEGILIEKDKDHVPIGLLQSAKVIRHIKAGDTIHFKDIVIPESEALEAWRQTVLNIKK